MVSLPHSDDFVLGVLTELILSVLELVQVLLLYSDLLTLSLRCEVLLLLLVRHKRHGAVALLEDALIPHLVDNNTFGQELLPLLDPGLLLGSELFELPQILLGAEAFLLLFYFLRSNLGLCPRSLAGGLH